MMGSAGIGRTHHAVWNQRAALEGVAAIAREAIGDLALGVDDAVPRDLDRRVEALKRATDKAAAPRHAGHLGDLAISRHPARRDAAVERSVDRKEFVTQVNFMHLRPTLTRGGRMSRYALCWEAWSGQRGIVFDRSDVHLLQLDPCCVAIEAAVKGAGVILESSVPTEEPGRRRSRRTDG